MEHNTVLPGINALILGPTGTGKTYSLGTIADAGIELFTIFTEPGLETLLGYWTDRGLPVPPNVHWHTIQRPAGSFATLAASAEIVNTYPQDALYKLSDPDRAKQNQFVKLLRALCNFPDDRTGETFGAVDSWNTSRCIAIDSLSGVTAAAFSLVIGTKPIKSQTDWGLCQDQIEKLVRLCTDSRAHFVLTAHVEREIDMVFGGVKVMVSAPGKALAPKLPPMFSDVILCQRNGTKFTWSTANAQVDLKARNLNIADNIEPGFKQIFNKWNSRQIGVTK